MELSDRQFAAAHDRLLEPPDDDDDGEETWAESVLAYMVMQKRLDREDWEARKMQMREDDK
jgi:hypothetical protein